MHAGRGTRLRTWLFIAALIASSVLMMAACIAWGYSYFYDVDVEYSCIDVQRGRETIYGARAGGAAVGFDWYRATSIAPRRAVVEMLERRAGEPRSKLRTTSRANSPFRRSYWFGFRSQHTVIHPGPYQIFEARFDSWSIGAPYWAIVLVTAVAPASRVWRFARERRARALALKGTCPTCGYDLRASADRCPECGTLISVRLGDHLPGAQRLTKIRETTRHPRLGHTEELKE
jgi:hypothetical protein